MSINQTVWKLATDPDKDLVIRTELDYFNNHFISVRLGGNWTPPPIRILGKSKRVRDFVSWMYQVPVISEKAKTALLPLIGEHCEILPLVELKKKMYYAVNVLTILDCLDKSASEILMAEDDPNHVLRIKSYVFKKEKIPFNVTAIPQGSAD